MSEHTPTPWNAASKYSSVVGVPIVNQQGKRIGNTALPNMPPEWDEMKRQAEVDAAFICMAVNSHEALLARVVALEQVISEEMYPENCSDDANRMLLESAIDSHQRRVRLRAAHRLAQKGE